MIVKCRGSRCKIKFKLIISFILTISMFVMIPIALQTSDNRNCVAVEPIDVVYTWVNGSDPKLLEQLKMYVVNSVSRDYSPQRFDDKHELKFSLRSLEKYAPWIRHVFVVTNGQIPYWLNLDYEKVTIVDHKDIFLDVNDLPSFSSPAIESHLHRIPGLSKHFIYFNDDILLGAPIHRDDFILSNGAYVIYFAYPLSECAFECPWLYVADGHCDSPCFNEDCQMDGGDCNEVDQNISEIVKMDENNWRKLYNKTGHRSFFVSPLHMTNLTDYIARHNNEILKNDKRLRKERQKTSRVKRRGREKDAYGLSLQHANRVFNRQFGFVPRQVPAHAPILINRDIMSKLQELFSNQFKKTSQNHIRSYDDMQFAFSYYYFLIHQSHQRSISEIFDHFDTDNSRFGSDLNVFSKTYAMFLELGLIGKFALF